LPMDLIGPDRGFYDICFSLPKEAARDQHCHNTLATLDLQG
jgi:hypothetical protein